MSIIDYRIARQDRAHARKTVSEIVSRFPQNVAFSRHALEEAAKDDLTTVDIWNVLKSSDARIIDEGELRNGSVRYRLETSFLMVVIAFQSDGEGLSVITVWDKRKSEGKS